MVSESFLAIRVRCCRDLLQVRRQARQVAQSLSLTPQEVICTAAGAFLVAQQARKLLRRADICFALADGQLRIFARPTRAGVPTPRELFTLVKQLPAGDRQLTPQDIDWLVRQLQLLAPLNAEEEISRQNQEMLQLLSRLNCGPIANDLGANRSAA